MVHSFDKCNDLKTQKNLTNVSVFVLYCPSLSLLSKVFGNSFVVTLDVVCDVVVFRELVCCSVISGLLSDMLKQTEKEIDG